jgi:rRNA-processing protein FCF1
MMPEPDCLSPQHVKARLQEIIEAIKDNRDIDVPETEIRELQHFFNERSAAFLHAARSELKMIETKKRRYKGPNEWD